MAASRTSNMRAAFVKFEYAPGGSPWHAHPLSSQVEISSRDANGGRSYASTRERKDYITLRSPEAIVVPLGTAE